MLRTLLKWNGLSYQVLVWHYCRSMWWCGEIKQSQDERKNDKWEREEEWNTVLYFQLECDNYEYKTFLQNMSSRKAQKGFSLQVFAYTTKI